MNKEDLDYFLENSSVPLHECIQDAIAAVSRHMTTPLIPGSLRPEEIRQETIGETIMEAIESAVDGFVDQHKSETEGEQSAVEIEDEAVKDFNRQERRQ